MPIYLDNAATSFPRPESVYRAVDECLRTHGGAFGRGTHALSLRAGDIVADCRRLIARLLDLPSPSHLVFTGNCTDSLNTVLKGLLRPGDRVVTTELEHNSVLRPLHLLQSETQVEVCVAAMDSQTGTVRLDEVAALVRLAPTKLVVFSHASNVTGVLQPVAELVDIAHNAGALVLLDAAQTAGHLPFSMQELGVEFLAAAGHKGLLGPLGTGILALKPGMEKLVTPLRCGGTGTSSESVEQPHTMPQRYESGNLNVPGIAGLAAGVRWILDRGLADIRSHTTELTRSLRQGLAATGTVRCLPERPDMASDDNFAAGIVSFVIDGMDSRDVGMILEQSFGIQCRTGLHCAPRIHRSLQTEAAGGTVRLSVGALNTADDVAAALAAVTQIAAAV